ncbi:hypothetical protein [Aliiroseovarius sp.]|uniref:hypothetical protein n=1 Tax=Aliiroseovarius sp. TaxID=1872442 RepID=UPI003BACCA49
MRQIIVIACLGLAVGCSDAPRLDPTLSARARDAAYPDLVPLGPLLAGLSAAQDDFGTGTLTARAAALRARAARLRGDVVDAPARDRMRAAVARHAR